MRSILAIIAIATWVPLSANGEFAVHDRVEKAYQAILQLKLDEAKLALNDLEIQEPDNLLVPYLEDYIDFLVLFLSEDRELYHDIKDRRSERLDRLKDGPEDSPWYLFTRAEVYLHWAVLRYKFGETLSAAADFNRAFRLLARNEERFPDFAPTYKNLGLLRMAVGTIPDRYMWAVRLFSSMDGDIEQGLRNLEKCMAACRDDGIFLLPEVELLYAQAQVHLMNDPESGWEFLSGIQLQPTSNPVHCFILANVAMKSGRNDKAIEVLGQQPSGRGQYPVAYLNLMFGRALLHKGDSRADSVLTHYLQQFSGENYVKEAWQKRGWYALMQGDQVAYRQMMDSCRVLGVETVGEDKNAMKEAESGRVPHIGLLEVRLLFDGAYYDEAWLKLNSMQPNDLADTDRLEYEYRKARLLHATGAYDEALRQYDVTIALGKDSDAYFACNAALQSGLIHEQLGHVERAETSFRNCLSLKPSDYQNSLHQKAKAGLNRLKSR